MAIRFVDVEPEKAEGGPSAPPRRARLPEAAPVQDVPASPAAEPAGDDAPPPGLPHAKPEPKARGRKKPVPAAGAEKDNAPDAPAAPLLDGLLPEFQVHAKPTPKPRGRKKAFG